MFTQLSKLAWLGIALLEEGRALACNHQTCTVTVGGSAAPAGGEVPLHDLPPDGVLQLYWLQEVVWARETAVQEGLEGAPQTVPVHQERCESLLIWMALPIDLSPLGQALS